MYSDGISPSSSLDLVEDCISQMLLTHLKFCWSDDCAKAVLLLQINKEILLLTIGKISYINPSGTPGTNFIFSPCFVIAMPIICTFITAFIRVAPREVVLVTGTNKVSSRIPAFGSQSTWRGGAGVALVIFCY